MPAVSLAPTPHQPAVTCVTFVAAPERRRGGQLPPHHWQEQARAGRARQEPAPGVQLCQPCHHGEAESRLLGGGEGAHAPSWLRRSCLPTLVERRLAPHASASLLLLLFPLGAALVLVLRQQWLWQGAGVGSLEVVACVWGGTVSDLLSLSICWILGWFHSILCGIASPPCFLASQAVSLRADVGTSTQLSPWRGRRLQLINTTAATRRR